ncbi:MAG: threonine/serine dehydratase [Holophagales bacterium]|nr:threonine/serine dehydratase [Holophagales bacterium]MYG32230.1 threonine/serine dehydratase [Holophagales bacterium]MYI78601.1 threonine/serine dehydratase [Holophagales bacterium]
MTDHPTLGDIVRAQHRLKDQLRPTPLEDAADLGAGTFLKLENANRTHSFKIRGALNAMLSLSEEALARGIVAASSGNFAMAVAYAARLCGASAQILMPVATPKKKISGVRRYGAGAAEAVLFGDNFDQAEAEALRRAQGGLTWLSPYNDRRVIAGAGTIGVEIVSELPRVERVLVPVGGGGLISGVATALKELNPAVEVVGVSAESTPAMFNVFHDSDRPQVWNTLAEALSGDIEPGSMTVPICERYLDDVVLVAEEQIASAMRFLVDVQGWVVEGGGAVGVAALLQGAVPRDGKRTAVVVSGGNVDGETLRRVLQVPEGA